jgi:ketosteroid isomerase-like protein
VSSETREVHSVGKGQSAGCSLSRSGDLYARVVRRRRFLWTAGRLPGWAVRRLPRWLRTLARIGVLPSNPDAGLVKAAYLAMLRAFNRGDLVTAFALMDADCEFRNGERLVLEAGVFAGRDQVIRFFEELREVVPDWRVENRRFLQGRDGVFVALDHGRGSGRDSGAPVATELVSVLELRDWLVVRVHQYSDWEDGLRAVGLDPAIAVDVRKAEQSAN